MNPAETTATQASVADDAPPRRAFLASLTAAALGVVALGTPLLAGLAMFLDPLVRRSRNGGGGGEAKFTRITAYESLPLDGAPVQFAIMEDKVDAWNREPNQPVGTIFVRRVGDQALAFNAVCPHAGCYVSYAASQGVFRCPCHNSSFELDGERRESPEAPNPSPRALDSLDVELRVAGTKEPIEPKEAAKATAPVEVWVRFRNFKAGTPKKIPA